MTPDNRLAQINHWLESLKDQWGLELNSLRPASSDASFRRYFRINSSQPKYPSLIVMDAPPDKEALSPFILVAELLKNADLNVPIVLEKNLVDGFLLLTDLGSETYLSRLNRKSTR